MLGWTVSCSVFWVNIDTTRYSATEFGRNNPTNFRLSGTLSFRVVDVFLVETNWQFINLLIAL